MSKAQTTQKPEEAVTNPSEFDKLFVEWDFHDLDGNRITIKPWSLTKSKKTLKIIGEIYKDMQDQYGVSDINQIFNEYPHAFFNNYFEKLCEVLYITTDRDEKWLDHVDIALGLEVLDVIWKQNFTGLRVTSQMAKWTLPAAPGQPSSRNLESLESLLPGNM